MAEFTIPLDDIDYDNPFFDFTVDLSGTIYTIEINWNTENEFWTLGLYTSDKQPITQGRKIVCNSNLFEFCSHELLPPGKLYAVDTSGNNLDPGEDDLGIRVILVYSDDT
jgi:hypothetical protein